MLPNALTNIIDSRTKWAFALATVSLCLLVSSCLMSGVDKIDADPDFDWNSIKRDEILMTPLIDLRDIITPPGDENLASPYTRDENIAYAEAFKQVFFKNRKDVRVYGAGGAFEKISSVENLSEIAKKVVSRKPLSLEETERLRATTQGIRFIFFFDFAKERLFYDYDMEKPPEALGLYVVKTYMAKREMLVKLALWDSRDSKTVFITEKTAFSTATNRLYIRTGLMPPPNLKVIPGFYNTAQSPDQADRQSFYGPVDEMAVHRARFPKFAAREPAFSGTFKNLVLSLPIHRSEQNLIEYENFTNHRPEITFKGSKLGRQTQTDVFFGFSSILYNRYRLGLGFEVSMNQPILEYGGKKYKVSNQMLAVTTDLEWELAQNWRLLTGSYFGAGAMSIKPKDSKPVTDPPTDNSETKSESDGYTYAAPRIRLIWGQKSGGQLGLGVFRQYYNRIDRPEFTDYKPSLWGGELTIAVQFRGF